MFKVQWAIFVSNINIIPSYFTEYKFQLNYISMDKKNLQQPKAP